MKISVSFLKSRYSKEETIEKINQSSCDFLHVDLMDGIYAGEKNYDMTSLLQLLQHARKPLEFHLMLENPMVEIIEISTLHPEVIILSFDIPDLLKRMEDVKRMGIKVGIAVHPKTSFEEVSPYLSEVDVVLVMSVVPGKGGQEFLDSTLPKLKEIYDYRQAHDLSFFLSIDGGIQEESAKKVKDYVDGMVSGSYVCMQEDYEEAIKKLK